MAPREISRRTFVRDLGRGGLAVAVFGLTAVACGGDDTEATTTSAAARTTTSAAPPEVSEGPTPATWERVNLGFVSAYILARRGEAAIVDTGVPGSEEDIEAGLSRLDLGWGDVGHVIVTHLHNDHQGSLPAVLGLATDATGYAGAADIPEISSPRELVAVGDVDKVFDLEIIATPGHTPGHVSVLDSAGGLLVAGDALNGVDGGVTGANPDFTADMVEAEASVSKLAGFAYDTVVFGHGEPVIGGAAAQVAALAEDI